MSRQNANQRHIEAASITITTFAVCDVGSNPLTWLKTQASTGMTLLMHTDEVVLWGYFADNKFHCPPQELYPHREVRPFTIQTVRLFDQTRETYLWQVGENQWQARTITDNKTEVTSETTPTVIHDQPTIHHQLDEEQILWGTQVDDTMDGFCRVSDGMQGLVHAPPLNLEEQQWSRQAGTQEVNPQRRLRLLVRHYLEEDPTTGWLRIVFSRLVNICAPGAKFVASQAANGTVNANKPLEEVGGAA